MAKQEASYQAKRDFSRTPEPAFDAAARPDPGGGTDKEGRPLFVIHRHEARRLHYDLRLATGGVLASWAVPRGFSYDPSVKHLAVHTEDHPMHYRTFEGVIPKGEYGAGTMQIWDGGWYELVKEPDFDAALESGELKFILRGRRLRGEWHMVRTGGGDRQPGAQEEWLLFKARDAYARDADELVPAVDTEIAKLAQLPRRPRLMKTSDQVAAFSDPDWVFELELSGIRTLLAKSNDDVRTVGENGSVVGAAALRSINDDLAAVRAERAVLDGVFVALDERNRPDPEAARSWARGAARADSAVSYYAFDLLYYDEWDLRALPLVERKHLLRALIPARAGLLYVDHVAGSGAGLAATATAAAAGFHSLIAKRGASSYRAGLQADWRRVAVAADPEAQGLEFNEALARSKLRQQGRTRFKLSNLNKVYWPREGYTKGDLISYYEQMAESLLPYLRDRPVHMNRYPDGIEGKSFYQRQAPEGVPDWVPLVDVDEGHTAGADGHDRQFVCNDPQTLLYLINLGSIELHPWLSQVGSLETPDQAVLDLDAKESSFATAVRIARTAGKVLRGIGLTPYVKTSGASGLHIYLPMVPSYSYDQCRMFIEGVARIVAREHPDIASVERLPGSRGGRVYVDYLQNRRSATVVPPYAVRPVPGARVSMPLDWDELDADLTPDRGSPLPLFRR